MMPSVPHPARRGPRGAAALLVAALLAACASRAPAPQTPTPPPEAGDAEEAGRAAFLLGPMVGHTTDESASFWVKADRPGTLSAIVVDERGESRRGEAALAGDGIGVVTVEDLSAATPYTVRFQLDGVPVEADPPVAFRTFPDDDDPAVFTIALVSCARVPWDSIQPIWRALDADRPDVVLWLGDNGYLEHADSLNPADYSDPARMESRYAEIKALPAVQGVLRHAPNYAIWDDRDYGWSDSDRL
ncbi:MAG TPA: hypothetical protein VM778_08715, partial [Gemmatimonadota bacterium]|nr:hypothetical protein [Gemmatimonadota bacterium]